MKKIAVYIRVSTAGQNQAGQQADVEKWLAGNAADREIIWFADKATGTNLRRPGFEKLQRAIFDGEIDTVVLWKLDRLSRNLREGLDVLCSWIDKSLRIVCVTQQIDFNGTIGKMMASVLLAVAEMEQENRKERQASGIAAAKKEGKYKGRKKGTTKVKPEQVAALLKRSFSVKEIAAQLGVTPMTIYRCKKQLEPKT